jgi:hypothetical protein
VSHGQVGPRECFRVPETVHARAFDDELIILDLGAGEYFSLDAIGTRAWTGFAAGRCAEEMAADLASAYDVDAERALRDLLSLATDLVARRLLVPEGSAK